MWLNAHKHPTQEQSYRSARRPWHAWAGDVVSGTLIVMFAVAMLVDTSLAQSQTGTLVGVVYDSHQQVIAGVDVRLSRADISHSVFHTTTGTNGRFRFVGLPAGVYSLELTRQGWQGKHSSDLTIEAARTLDINMTNAHLHQDANRLRRAVSRHFKV